MPRKPAGVIVAAVVLLLVSILFLVGTGFWVLAAVAFKHNPDMALSGPGAGAASANLVMGMIGFLAIVCAILGIGGISTSMGLFRMKNWARISIAVIGGIVGVLGLLGAAFCAILPGAIKSMGRPIPPPTTPQMINAVFFSSAVFMLLVAAVGIWWLVYFLLRSTRLAFNPVLATPAPNATWNYPAPSMTDFTIAQPLPPAPPAEHEPPQS